METSREASPASNGVQIKRYDHSLIHWISIVLCRFGLQRKHSADEQHVRSPLRIDDREHELSRGRISLCCSSHPRSWFLGEETMSSLASALWRTSWRRESSIFLTRNFNSMQKCISYRLCFILLGETCRISFCLVSCPFSLGLPTEVYWLPFRYLSLPSFHL